MEMNVSTNVAPETAENAAEKVTLLPPRMLVTVAPIFCSCAKFFFHKIDKNPARGGSNFSTTPARIFEPSRAEPAKIAGSARKTEPSRAEPPGSNLPCSVSTTAQCG